MVVPESPISASALPQLPADLLSRTATEGVRRVLLATLQRTAAAAERLADPADAEALHDFRVGLRRLRSQLKAFREWVADEVPRRLERRLRKAARATNRGRDAEVQARALEQLATAGGGLSSSAGRVLAAGLARRLGADRDEASESSIGRARRDFESVRRALDKRLRIVHLEVDLSAGLDVGGVTGGRESRESNFGELAARQIGSQLARVRERFAEARGIDPPDVLHAARIEGKRLRYLLEPMREVDPAVGPLLVDLKRLQDILGEFHDACVLERIAGDALTERARERAATAVAAVAASGLASEAASRARRHAMPWALLEIVDLARRRQRSAWRRLARGRAARQLLLEQIDDAIGRWAQAPLA
jgi:CHAD domain-containing protein